MNYEEAEQFLLSLGNLPRQEYMESRRDMGQYLKRLKFFLSLLHNPEKTISHCIHVTGTSGKGSVATVLANILEASGAKTGLMISPHVTHLCERWQINGKIMSKAEFVEIIAAFKPALDRYTLESPYDPLSFFDLVTSIGFYYFAQNRVEWAVVEVGCGGRYDATNAMPRKDIAVITNVGLDHTDILGDTKVKIAYAKAGIITRGCRVFTMEKNKAVLAVITEECKKKKARLTKISALQPASAYAVSSPGKHQQLNAKLCIGVAKFLKLGEAAIQRGLDRAKQPLRFEIVSQQPFIILDGAHNPDKIKSTVATLKAINHAGHPIHLLVGFSGDKDVNSLIRQLSALQPVTIACTRNTVNPFRKVANPKAIMKQFNKLLPQAETEIFLDPRIALDWSMSKMAKDAILLITGSIFLSGELRPILTK